LEEREALNERIRAALAAGLPPEQRPLENDEAASGAGSAEEKTAD
jgi:hypothetical protein